VRAYQTCPAKILQHGRQGWRREIFGRGNFLNIAWRLALTSGKIDQGANGVLAWTRKKHIDFPIVEFNILNYRYLYHLRGFRQVLASTSEPVT
jgi:hypothetical protein